MNRKQRRATQAVSPADATFRSALGFHRQGQLAKADPLYRRALQLDPRHAESLHFLGLLSFQSGRGEESAALLGRALALTPDNPALHFNTGTTFRALGRLEEAVAHYRRAIALQPSHQGAYNNLGAILHGLGRHAEAGDALRKAIALGADANVHFNLARLLLDEREVERAVFHFRQALALAPDQMEARLGLADAQLALGDAPGALDELCRVLAASDAQPAHALFAACIAAMPPAPVRPEIIRLLERALMEGWGRPRDLARFATAVVSGRHAAPADIAGLAQDTLLAALLASTPIVDRTLERLLTAARTTLLARAGSDPDAVDGLRFWCDLAQQCFLNEHVFASTADEERRVAELANQLTAALDGGAPIPPLRLVAFAACSSAVNLPGAARLLSRSWPAPLRTLLQRQVAEPLAERDLQAAMPHLTPIDDTTSLAVRAQYEENPYPRWTTVPAPGEAVTADIFLARRFPGTNVRIAGQDGGCDILIAGCGTGQQSIEIARGIRNARVLAVDLSSASLAYAQRQTAALGVTGIEYAQADILRLGESDRRFDIIQASGVLHHMADPVRGLGALLPLLRPGGAMLLGLYSEIARRDVVAARDFIAGRGFQPTPGDIRRCRQVMMEADDGTALRRLSGSSDFGSMSGCRDLLFHVQEHRFTLPEIANALDALGLAFMGFDLPATVMQAYRARFPDDRAATDLRHWDAFEQVHPSIFSGMYQFWIRRSADASPA